MNSFLYKNQNGGVFLYILLAIGLLGLLTFTFVDEQGDDAVAQRAQALSQELYNQLNMVAAKITQCTVAYPNSVDLDGDGDIDNDDNPNPPWPLEATDPNNPAGAAAQVDLRFIQCPGAPANDAYIFEPNNKSFPSHPGEVKYWFNSNAYVDPNRWVSVSMYLDGNNAAAGLAADILENRFNDACRFTVDKTTYAPDIRITYFLYKNYC